MAKSDLTPVERFWSFVNKNGPAHPELGTRCWLWTGRINTRGGHARFWNGSAYEVAHRFAYGFLVGAIPGDARVLHRCDTPACTRPDHLFLGTQGDNVRDMERKGRGRHPHGEASGKAKLTEAQVREIRAALEDGMSQPVRRGGKEIDGPRAHQPRGLVSSLAARYAVTRETIWNIGRRAIWDHLS